MGHSYSHSALESLVSNMQRLRAQSHVEHADNLSSLAGKLSEGKLLFHSLQHWCSPATVNASVHASTLSLTRASRFELRCGHALTRCCAHPTADVYVPFLSGSESAF